MVDYTLTMVSATGGSVSPSAGANVYASGTEVTVTATASAGYRFEAWLRNGLRTSLPNPYVFNITKNLTLTPIFTQPDNQVLTSMQNIEQQDFGTYCFEPGCVEGGVDNDVPLRRKLIELENQQ